MNSQDSLYYPSEKLDQKVLQFDPKNTNAQKVHQRVKAVH